MGDVSLHEEGQHLRLKKKHTAQAVPPQVRPVRARGGSALL